MLHKILLISSLLFLLTGCNTPELSGSLPDEPHPDQKRFIGTWDVTRILFRPFPPDSAMASVPFCPDSLSYHFAENNIFETHCGDSLFASGAFWFASDSASCIPSQEIEVLQLEGYSSTHYVFEGNNKVVLKTCPSFVLELHLERR